MSHEGLQSFMSYGQRSEISGQIDHSPRSEKPPKLTDFQELTAGIHFSIALFKEFEKDAKGQLPWLRSQNTGDPNRRSKSQDRGLLTRHFAGLLDAYQAIEHPEDDARQSMLDSWGEKKYYLEQRASEIRDNLTEKKDTILANAEDSDPFDYQIALNQARKYAKRLRPEQRTLLYPYAGIDPAKVRAELAKSGVTGAAFAASTAAIDTMAFIAGTAAVGASSLAKHQADNVPTVALLVAWGLTYGYWGYEMRGNLKQNFAALEQEGVSTNTPSQAGYELAIRLSDDKKLHKAAAHTGYIGTEAVKEVPWLFPFALSAAELVTTNEALIFCVGANIGAGLYERVAAKITEKLLKKRREKYNARYYRGRIIDECTKYTDGSPLPYKSVLQNIRESV